LRSDKPGTIWYLKEAHTMKHTFVKILFLPIIFTVCLSMALAQTNSTVRLEQNDESITYTGDWYNNNSLAHSGGSAALTNARGATATVSFTGTGITWIGIIDPWSGFANAFLDGTLYIVDGYGNNTLYQSPLFSVQGLPAGPHTLSIDVTHTRDGNARGAWVFIDAFDISNGSGIPGGVVATPGRIEQKNPASIYSGSWFTNEHAMHSGGSAALSIDAGSSVTFSFEGTGISWIAYRDEWSGIARVILDGTTETLIDTFASPSKAQTAAYTVDNLPSGVHTLTIEVTGSHNPNSYGSWIWVDAFDVTGP
jgi:hypothetical protein